MTLEQFMINEKMTVNGPEAQAYVYYDRVSVNGVPMTSPWFKLKPGDIVVLRPKDGGLKNSVYKEVSNDSH